MLQYVRSDIQMYNRVSNVVGGPCKVFQERFAASCWEKARAQGTSVQCPYIQGVKSIQDPGGPNKDLLINGNDNQAQLLSLQNALLCKEKNVPNLAWDQTFLHVIHNLLLERN